MSDWQPYPVEKQQPRKNDMQVLCLGLSRTSTMSLHAALTKLGYKPYHMFECCLDHRNESLQNWDKAIKAKFLGQGKPFEGQDFDKMLWKFDAVTDIPCVLFSDELLAAYPNAKVVLTPRNSDAWLASVERSFYEILSWKRWPILQLLDPAFTRVYIPILTQALKCWTGGDWQNRKKLQQGFIDHYNHIRKVVPQENLLEFYAKDGWEPLCKFLGKPVPEGPYPRLNEGSNTADLHSMLFWGRLIEGVGPKAAAVLVLGLGLWFGLRRW